MRSSRTLAVTGVLLFSTLACNLQGGQEIKPDLAATITAQAQTLQAPAATGETPIGNAAEGVEVSVTSVTNCRTGPSQVFDLVMTADAGQSFKVVGKNTPTGYWIITEPSGGTCWLWGRYAVLSGDPSTLPEYPAPSEPTPRATKTPKPTKTPSPTDAPTSGLTSPADPGNFAYTRTCTGFMDGATPKWREDITFTWDDNSNNEDGFRLYTGPSSSNVSLLQTLLANAESTYDTRTYNQGTGGPLFDNYQLVAYNGAGGSFGGAVDVPRCP